MNAHVFSGHAQLPEGTNLYENYKYATVVMKIDMDSGEILGCVVPIYCKLHNDFIAEIVCGKFMDRDMSCILEEIEERVHSLSTRALISALQVVWNRYLLVKKNARTQKECRTVSRGRSR